MVGKHVPPGTPITDPKLIKLFKNAQPVINGSFKITFGLPNYVASEMYYPSKWNPPSITLTYQGILDDEGSGYMGEWFQELFGIVLSKDISPDTHNVYVNWIKIPCPFPSLLAYTTNLVIKPKEVMQW